MLTRPVRAQNMHAQRTRGGGIPGCEVVQVVLVNLSGSRSTSRQWTERSKCIELRVQILYGEIRTLPK